MFITMKQYYYSDGKQQIGPLSKEELASKSINKETLVWFEDLPEWTKAGDVEELVDLFKSAVTPPPMPGQKMVTPPPMPKNNNVSNSPKDKQRISNNQEVAKSKSKKKIFKIIGIAVGIVLLVFIVREIIDIVNTEKSHSEIERVANIEKNNPAQCLELKEMHITGNTLMGIITNKARYTHFTQVLIKVSYYDNDGKVLQSDKYTIEAKDGGCFLPQLSQMFEIKIKELKGIKNKLKLSKSEVVIVGAKTK